MTTTISSMVLCRNASSTGLWNSTDCRNSSTEALSTAPHSMRWEMVSLLLVILCAALGNLLVCMAVCWERRLQNMTNYFLMSLAIADFLVSVLVMPIGMVVEIYGYFPMNRHLCLFWITMDVLMCTASIWHMSTMSMDRFFTLKYPMRYGRNKTKQMVCMKILFVWLVSLAVCSPISIHGLIDTSTVYNNGLCIPTLPSFVIYGSIFAFYIPLMIMIITYALTIQILWNNQKLMQKIEQFERNPKVARLNPEYKKAYMENSVSCAATPTGNANRVLFSDLASESRDISESFSSQSKLKIHSNQSACTLLNSDSYATTSNDCQTSAQSFLDQSTQSQQALIRLKKYDKKQFLQPMARSSARPPCFKYPSNPNLTSKESEELYASASYSHFLEVPNWKGTMRRKNSLGHSYHGLSSSYMNSEWSDRFLQIQCEMDQCLQDAEQDNHSSADSSSEGPGSHSAKHHNALLDLSSSEDDPPTRKQLYQMMMQRESPDNNKNSFIHQHKKELPIEITLPNSHEAEPEEQSPMLRKVKRTVRNFLKDKLGNTHKNTEIRKAFKHILPTKTATNEKKALKVLGIIFIVFVVLWTPFFIVNIMSVTCQSCMTNVTPQMMSTFLWMGYIASLANPLIYTMFNTAFRRAFLKILTCKYQHGHRHFPENPCLTLAASWHSERRNTVTIFIRDELS